MPITIDPSKCTACKKCEEVCPALAIDHTKKYPKSFCIECFHCIATCKSKAIQNNNEEVLDAPKPEIKSSEMGDLIVTRRSRRNFKSQPVSNETIENFIKTTSHSPTASNSQQLCFSVITDQALLKTINDTTISTLLKTFNTALNPFVTPFLKLFIGKAKVMRLMIMKDNIITKAKLRPNMITYNAPALILVHAPITKNGMPCHDANIWTGMALLYAETLKLGTCVNGFIVHAAKRNKELKEKMGIPKNHLVHSTILIGYPKDDYTNKIERKTPNISFN